MTQNDSRLKIINAARKAFAEKGHDGVSMSEIAQIAGVKKSLIYYYFPSKEDLFFDVWEFSIDDLEGHLFGDIEGESKYLGKIKKVLKSYIDFLTSRNEVKKIILMEKGNLSRIDENTWIKASKRYDDLKKRISELILRAKEADVVADDVDPKGAAELILNGFNPFSSIEEMKTVEEIILRGLISKKEI